MLSTGCEYFICLERVRTPDVSCVHEKKDMTTMTKVCAAHAIMPKTSSIIRSYFGVFRGEDLGGRGDRPPQIFRWRGRRCFYPPMFRKCHCKLSRWKRLRRRETEDTTPVTHQWPTYKLI